MDKLVNFWRETIRVLELHNKTWNDVEFICDSDANISKSNFENVAKNTNYDNGFGGQRIASDLMIVGSDWWLERHEYDGSEWWEFKKAPKRFDNTKNVVRFDGGCWNTLSEINGEKEY